MEQVAECSETLNDAEENNTPRTLPNFQINRDIIESVTVENQSEELRALGITVYDQSKFEEGILRQVDDALEEQERQSKAKKKKLLPKNGREEQNLGEIVKKQEETEKEKMVRLGQMTPFGTVLGAGKITQELTSFEKYLLEQEKLRNDKAKSTSKKGKSLKSPAVVRNSSPVKELKKRNAIPHRKEITKKHKPVFKTNGSDSEYIPSDEESHKPEVSTTSKKRRRRESNKEEWNTDDSDWEYSDEEVSKKRCIKKPGRIVDDGNINDYHDRLAELPNFETDNQDYEEFEGGYRIPLSIWNQLYNYQKVHNNHNSIVLFKCIVFNKFLDSFQGWSAVDVRIEASTMWWDSWR